MTDNAAPVPTARAAEAATRRRPGRPFRGGVLLACIAAAGALLAGCSGGDSSATGSGSTATSSAATTPPSAPSPAAGSSTATSGDGTAGAGSGTSGGGGSTATEIARCATEQLTGALGHPGAGAGQRTATLTLTNTGGQPCRIEGYGGIELVDGSGHALPTQQVRDPQAAPTPFVLIPGAHAVSQLSWTVVPSGKDAPSGPCQPTPTALQVIPPDERAALSAAWSFGPVCAGGRIEQQAYHPVS